MDDQAGPRRPATSFRRRLIIAFLLLGVTPAAIITFFTLREFGGLAKIWQNPVMGTLIDHAVQLARLSLAPAELDATALAHRIAEDRALAAAVLAGDTGGAEGRLRGHLARDAGGPSGSSRFAAFRTLGRSGSLAGDRAGDGRAAPAGPDSSARPAAEANARDAGSWHTVGSAPPLSRARRLPAPGSPGIDPQEGVVWCRLAFPAESGLNGEIVAGYRLSGDVAAGARVLDEALPLFRSLGTYELVRIRSFWTLVVTLFLVLVFSAWFAARLLAGSLAQPILELEKATRRVAAGDYSHRIVPHRPDELGRLVDAFNRMTADLRDGTEKLRRAERVAAWRDVARGLAHQIKNPLTPIRISSHRLRALPHPPGSRERALLDDCLGTLDHEVSNLERIADEFSRFARLPEPRPVPIDLAALVREVAELYAGGHAAIRLRVDIAPDLPVVRLDPDLTRQVISNLVKNAVEAMTDGGDLTVRVEPLARAGGAAVRGAAAAGGGAGSRAAAASAPATGAPGPGGTPELAGTGPGGAMAGAMPAATADGRGVRILVSDTGPGIPADLRERLFTPYLTTKAGGTGLGLALSHRMVADQGGSLEVLTGSGPGTTFQIDFPGEILSRDRSTP